MSLSEPKRFDDPAASKMPQMFAAMAYAAVRAGKKSSLNRL